MSKQFEFADFVDEFYVPFTYIKQSEGYWTDSGDWVEGSKTPVSTGGIVLPLSEDDLKYSEAGTYSEKDKKVYVTTELKIGNTVLYKDDEYTIQNFKDDYSDYADVYIYLMRWRQK
ncbi:hypothetical protein [Bacillus sp. JJ722]|uniref:hypothetical protein n=1 Tax=Bacillus sp. JJ722 TaxID=3122973 RepID=UPI0030005F0F